MVNIDASTNAKITVERMSPEDSSRSLCVVLLRMFVSLTTRRFAAS